MIGLRANDKNLHFDYNYDVPQHIRTDDLKLSQISLLNNTTKVTSKAKELRQQRNSG